MGTEDIKKSKSKIIIAIISILIILIAIFVILIKSYSSKDNVQEPYSPSYSKEDIEDAKALVNSQFNKNFKGCTLNSLSYDEEFTNEYGVEISKKFDNAKVIVINTSFTTDGTYLEEPFQPFETYDDWRWVLTESDDNNWIIQTNGY